MASDAMTMSDDRLGGLSDKGEHTLCGIFQSCQGIFQTWILKNPKDPGAEPRQPGVDTQKLLDEYARLKVWGRESKAVLRPEAHGSLDDTLRHNQDVASNVRDILQQLKKLLVIATSSDSDSDTEMDDADSDSSMSDSDDGGHLSMHEELLEQVSGQIKLLYHLASLLRRQGLHGRYLKSERTVESDKVSALFPYYLGHVREMRREWIFTQQDSRPALPEPRDQVPVRPADILLRAAGEDGEKVLESIMEQFAQANIRRYEQLRYWAKRPFIEATMPEVVPVELHAEQGGPAPSRGRTSKRNRDGTASEGKTLNSIQTAQTFSTVAKSAILDSETVTGRPKTVYAPSNVGAKAVAGVPSVPSAARSDDNPEFECPYCHAQLNSKQMRDRDNWKRHVFRDLRPYTCTFPRCTSAAKMYATRHEWITHEMQLHRRHWKCNECSLNFETESEMRDHLECHHAEAWEPRQLGVLLDMSERPIDDDVLAECPLCPVTEPLGRLLKHLAGHLEEISVFVLPTHAADGDGDADSKKVGVLSDRAALSTGTSEASTSTKKRNKTRKTVPEPAKEFDELSRVFEELRAREEPGHPANVDIDNYIRLSRESQAEKPDSASTSDSLHLPPGVVNPMVGDGLGVAALLLASITLISRVSTAIELQKNTISDLKPISDDLIGVREALRFISDRPELQTHGVESSIRPIYEAVRTLENHLEQMNSKARKFAYQFFKGSEERNKLNELVLHLVALKATLTMNIYPPTEGGTEVQLVEEALDKAWATAGETLRQNVLASKESAENNYDSRGTEAPRGVVPPPTVEEQQRYTIRCRCGNSKDDGNTLYCRGCGTWQHRACFYPDLPIDQTIVSHQCHNCERRPPEPTRMWSMQESILATKQNAMPSADIFPSINEDYTICGFDDDDGNTVYCEDCQTWQHIECFYPNNAQDLAQDDFDHNCHRCKPRRLDIQQAVERQQAMRNLRKFPGQTSNNVLAAPTATMASIARYRPPREGHQPPSLPPKPATSAAATSKPVWPTRNATQEFLTTHVEDLQRRGSSGNLDKEEQIDVDMAVDAMDVLEGPEPLECPICGMQVHSLESLIQHRTACHPPQQVFRCPEAGCKYEPLGWPSEKELQRHHNDVHPSIPRTFVCSFGQCRKRFGRVSDFMRHMESVHQWRRQAYFVDSQNEDLGPQMDGEEITGLKSDPVPASRPSDTESVNAIAEIRRRAVDAQDAERRERSPAPEPSAPMFDQRPAADLEIERSDDGKLKLVRMPRPDSRPGPGKITQDGVGEAYKRRLAEDLRSSGLDEKVVQAMIDKSEVQIKKVSIPDHDMNDEAFYWRPETYEEYKLRFEAERRPSGVDDKDPLAIFEHNDADSDHGLPIVRPHHIEYADSDRSRSRSRLNSATAGIQGLAVESDLDTDGEEAEFDEAWQRLRNERMKRRQLTSGRLGKRARSESIGSESGREDSSSLVAEVADVAQAGMSRTPIERQSVGEANRNERSDQIHNLGPESPAVDEEDFRLIRVDEAEIQATFKKETPKVDATDDTVRLGRDLSRSPTPEPTANEVGLAREVLRKSHIDPDAMSPDRFKTFAQMSPSAQQGYIDLYSETVRKPHRTPPEELHGLLSGSTNDGQWFCKCTPRKPAVKQQVKKAGPNQGRYYYLCQLGRDKGCGFFLWENMAQDREKSAGINADEMSVDTDPGDTESARQGDPQMRPSSQEEASDNDVVGGKERQPKENPKLRFIHGGLSRDAPSSKMTRRDSIDKEQDSEDEKRDIEREKRRLAGRFDRNEDPATVSTPAKMKGRESVSKKRDSNPGKRTVDEEKERLRSRFDKDPEQPPSASRTRRQSYVEPIGSKTTPRTTITDSLGTVFTLVKPPWEREPSSSEVARTVPPGVQPGFDEEYEDGNYHPYPLPPSSKSRDASKDTNKQQLPPGLTSSTPGQGPEAQAPEDKEEMLKNISPEAQQRLSYLPSAEVQELAAQWRTLRNEVYANGGDITVEEMDKRLEETTSLAMEEAMAKLPSMRLPTQEGNPLPTVADDNASGNSEDSKSDFDNAVSLSGHDQAVLERTNADKSYSCICNRTAHGKMIACDMPECPTGWYHFSCVGLKEAPPPSAKWYCPSCLAKRDPSGWQRTGPEPESSAIFLDSGPQAPDLGDVAPDDEQAEPILPARKMEIVDDYDVHLGDQAQLATVRQSLAVALGESSTRSSGQGPNSGPDSNRQRTGDSRAVSAFENITDENLDAGLSVRPDGAPSAPPVIQSPFGTGLINPSGPHINPGPVKKKLSLSDYTKTRRAAAGRPDEPPVGTSLKPTADHDDPKSASRVEMNIDLPDVEKPTNSSEPPEGINDGNYHAYPLPLQPKARQPSKNSDEQRPTGSREKKKKSFFKRFDFEKATKAVSKLLSQNRRQPSSPHPMLPEAQPSVIEEGANDDQPAAEGTYDILWWAASLFEFNIETTKREAGYPYLLYEAGQIFHVIAAKGELWLARKADKPDEPIGWVWSKHCAKLADE